MNKILFSSNSDDWCTPKILYDYFMKNGCIDLFPFHSSYDEYDRDYKNDKLFINPPYSQLNSRKFYLFINKLILNKNEIFLLIPNRSDTCIFQYLLCHCDYIYFIKGRLHFNDIDYSAPFPSVILHLVLKESYSHSFGFGSVEEYING